MYEKMNQATEKPVVWSAYTADLLWTDTHTSEQMLAFHLNPELSLASRTQRFIESSVDWLVEEFQLNETSKVIDFGCGPGLYTQRFGEKEIGVVVGLDFSQNSLNYAKEQASQRNLSIEYHYGNYLDYQDVRKFDLITMVMCDLCALNPQQRSQLLGKFKSMLAPNGAIALDVYTATRFDKQTEFVTVEKNSMHGFWSKQDYWCVQSSFTYAEAKVTLDKYVISEADRERTVFNWLQHFSVDMLRAELEPCGLEIKAIYSDLCGTPLADGDEMALVIGHK